jgi:2-dehydropantoate 2-reductase
MRILVLGAGAVGGYFGGRLVEAGADVTFLVRPGRAKQLAEHGLVVHSKSGDIARPVPTVGRDTISSPFDLVILTCKAYDLDDAMNAMAPAVGPKTAVLPLLNGLAHMEALDARFGEKRVLGGICHIGSTMTAEGEIRHLNPLQVLTLGLRSGESSPLCAGVADLLKDGPVKVVVSDSIMLNMWEKFVMLTSMAAMTCLMRAAVGDIMAADEGEAITLETLDECARVATAAGYAPRDKVLAQTRGLQTERGSTFSASMLRDIEKGGAIEGDHIVGDMLSRARALGVPTPNLRLAYCHLQAYQARRVREGRT